MDQNRTPLLLLVTANLRQSWRRLKAVGRQSRLLTAVIAMFVVGYLVLSFWLFWMGLKFLGTFPGLGVVLVERLLYLLFAFLFVLLLLSNLVISYTNFFRNREAQFLVSLPVSAQTIFRWKFLESVVLASWAFIFLIAPLLAAYGLKQGVPWHFYPVTLTLIGLFIVLPGLAGSWLAVTVARCLDRRAFQVVAVGGAALLLVAAAVWLRPEPVAEDLPELRVLAVLDRLLARTQFAQHPFLPSYWLSTAVLRLAEGAMAAAGFFVLVLFSHVLFFGSLAFTKMGGVFFDAFSTAHSRGSVFSRWKWFQTMTERRRRFTYPQSRTEKFLSRIPPLTSDVSALLLKDARIFWRDTTQWGQSLVLFGLLGVYIINLRHFSQQLTNPFWVHLVSYLNLAACSLNLATLTTRFVYPQFSLEGKRLWIVGMAPLGLVRIVKTKFWQASVTSLAITATLIFFSCQMLKMPAIRTLYFTGVIAVMTLTLNGLAVGLGALYPNFKEENPSKIVSGFGGTFCLVLSFLYIVASVALLAVGSPWARYPQVVSSAACVGGFLVLSLTLGRLPFVLGLRKVRTFEV
jgi:ABC-2 type transport system permease protein